MSYNILKQSIEYQIEAGKYDFAIYPFGNYGKMAKKP